MARAGERGGTRRRARGGAAGAGRGARGARVQRLPATGRVSSPYGVRTHPITRQKKLHGGVDIAVKTGTPVRATGGGKIIRAGWENQNNQKQGYGKRVTIDHGKGNVSIYGHLSEIHVSVGDTVKREHVVGKSGNTGASTSPHLHYEERYKGKPHEPTFNPAQYRPARRQP
jgi:murein DD-endopeptidase MepM/ murein hydrolase activator NlpD